MTRPRKYPTQTEWKHGTQDSMLVMVAMDIEQEWRWYLDNKPNAVLEDAIHTPHSGVFFRYPAHYDKPTQVARELTDQQYVQYAWIHFLPELPLVKLRKEYWMP